MRKSLVPRGRYSRLVSAVGRRLSALGTALVVRARWMGRLLWHRAALDLTRAVARKRRSDVSEFARLRARFRPEFSSAALFAPRKTQDSCSVQQLATPDHMHDRSKFKNPQAPNAVVLKARRDTGQNPLRPSVPEIARKNGATTTRTATTIRRISPHVPRILSHPRGLIQCISPHCDSRT
jgi:hypothetical protein